MYKQNKLTVGFIGAGFIAEFHRRALEQVRNFELTAILYRESSHQLKEKAEKSGLPSPLIVQTVEELCNKVDVVAIYSPNDTKVDVMREIHDAKKKGAGVMGVICDKPLGRNLKEAMEMARLAKAANLKTAYFENQIHMKALHAHRVQLEPQIKKMGPLALVRSSEEHSGPHMSWFWDPIRQGGGVLSDMGCHSIAVGWYCLTPPGQSFYDLVPQSIVCDLGLLKWGTAFGVEKLKKKFGVDYSKTPAEDFATGIVTFKNKKTGQIVKAQFTDSWMFDKQGLRLWMDGLGPGYSFEINTLVSPVSLFVGDEAQDSILDGESAIEKSTSTKGLMNIHYNESDLYGYTDENKDAAMCFSQHKDALLDFEFGVQVTKLVMAAYLSSEKREVIDLTCPKIQEELISYIPLIQQGLGKEVLFR